MQLPRGEWMGGGRAQLGFGRAFRVLSRPELLQSRRPLSPAVGGPKRNAPEGLSPSRSMGTARIGPSNPPMSKPQTKMETITVIGCRPTEFPTIRGAIKIASRFCTTTKTTVMRSGCVQSPHCAAAMRTAGIQHKHDADIRDHGQDDDQEPDERREIQAAHVKSAVPMRMPSIRQTRSWPRK